MNGGNGNGGLLGALVGSKGDCDTGNSLARLVNHSAQKSGSSWADRLESGSPGPSAASSSSSAFRQRSLRNGGGAHMMAGSMGRAEFRVEEFLEQHQQGGSGGHHPFEFGELRHELDRSLAGPPPAAAAAAAARARPAVSWADEFSHPHALHHIQPQQQQQQQQQHDFAEFEHVFANAGLHRAAANGGGDWEREFVSAASASGIEIDGVLDTKSMLAGQNLTPVEREAFELEWTKQFDAVQNAIQGKEPFEGDLLATAGGSSEWEQQFQEHVSKGPQSENDGEWFEKFNEIWSSLKGQHASGGDMDEFGFGFDTQDFGGNMDLDFEDAFQRSLAGDNRDLFGHGGDEFGSLSEMVDPDPVTAPAAPYTFETENPYLDHPDPLAEGLSLIRQQGSLSQAALAFEAAVQRDGTNSDAWMFLGRVQAENEKDGPAIAALQRSVQENPANTSALMSLAVSYVNERQELQAYATLDRWLSTCRPDVAQSMASPSSKMGMYPNSADMQARLTTLFLSAAHDGESSPADADLQVGLGLLYYSVEDFAKSVDCFTAALSVRPNDYILWNHLGATLTNSGRTEEAIDAYYKALELKPTFVRARYNLGVGCNNIGCYREAVEHLLGALSLHGSNHQQQANVSRSLWETLRRTFSSMGRRDLAEKARSTQDLDVFRAEFDF